MDDTREQTGETTIDLLEARLLRVEHLLYGVPDPATAPTATTAATPTVETLTGLERRFSWLVSNVRVYSELLKIYQQHPSLFQAPPAGVPPTQLDAEALRAIVLSYASDFPATASALNAALVDIPVPAAGLSTRLVALLPRMHALDASQEALDAEVATLRARSERVVKRYYERRALVAARLVADVETRLEHAEGRVRHIEKETQRTEASV